MLLYTFCVDIKKHSQDTLTKCLLMLIKSLDNYIQKYKLIIYTNFNIKLDNKNVTFRKYYDKTISKNYNNDWLNLSFNKINIYKDLYD